MAPPSVYDTHCEGPGLLPTTTPWSQRYCKLRQYTGESLATLSFPSPTSPDYDCTGKTVIISGSNSGIGKEAAIFFAAAGANVIMACRVVSHEQHPKEARKDVVAAAKVEDDKVEMWEIDCSSLASVSSFAARFIESGRTLDILVNNAGLTAGKRRITDEGFELTRAVNLLSHVLLTLSLLPAMKKSKAPRVVNTCSIFHHGAKLDFANMDNEKATPLGPNCVQAYCDSKLWLLMWSVELQERLSRSEEYRHVVVHGIHPGFVGSNIWANPDSTTPRVLKMIIGQLVNRLSVSSKQGSFAIVHAALAPELGVPKEMLREKSKLEKGESAKWGGKFVNRNVVDATRRPEVDDVLARSRLWQRVWEDVEAEKRGLGKDLPGHLESVKLLGQVAK
ncbi:Short-chain dehydrogenase/reductase SDR [Kalmanozyma brasiliensis GHG001]|nr:Short-chain dehydrogenase/reductase SDR [Kalmanozyma brasiliensis GHG001]KAF6767170.1 Short-chain dehydrogenase/reductase SDR [Kalmanozyma brasiliensis GHG001]